MSFCTLTLAFLCYLCVRPGPKLHLTESSGFAISTCTTLEIELFTVLNSFAGAVKTSISILVSGGGKSMRSL